ncbi:hypothetical protein SAMN05216582_12130 [Selenomonas ruminantium]|uniref:Uncharacterized protein n=1 Tax=Selenomonas ruminantium TaxID=971 RepID=A0A1M6VXK9_SELRU|nr:hypothetical protein [Selenomonas ruminantium]SHK86220.1 hypothetical protein SAMN05216582_12130 [Selenomonas ruminantium]
MLERIERVARIKGVEGRAFERKEGYSEDKRNKQSFKNALNNELDKEARLANEAGIDAPGAYKLELSTHPTQSLFYKEYIDFRELENRINPVE